MVNPSTIMSNSSDSLKMGGATFLGFLKGVQKILKAIDAPHFGDMAEAILILDFKEKNTSFCAVVMRIF